MSMRVRVRVRRAVGWNSAAGNAQVPASRLAHVLPIVSRRDSWSLLSLCFAPRNLPRPILPANVLSSPSLSSAGYRSTRRADGRPCAPRAARSRHRAGEWFSLLHTAPSARPGVQQVLNQSRQKDAAPTVPKCELSVRGRAKSAQTVGEGGTGRAR